MLNRFRSVVSNVMGGIAALPQAGGGGGERGDGGGGPAAAVQRPRSRSLPSPTADLLTNGPSAVKYSYDRPAFLQLNADEVQVSADTMSRPILVPRDISRLPWNAGYAEVINAGKTKFSEDQAWAGTLDVPREPSSVPEVQTPNTSHAGSPTGQSSPSIPRQTGSPRKPEYEILADDPLPFTYFGLFDGHAGTGAAIMAVKLLHRHIQVQLSMVRELLIAKRYNLDLQPSTLGGAGRGSIGRQALPDKTHLINVDDLVIGALETAFQNMDDQIGHERTMYRIAGGCTALVALFFMGKLYIANAGDSRAVLVCREKVMPMSSDFTPDSERQRIQYLGYLQPQLLHSEFTHLEFPRRVSRRDLGKKMLYKDALMKGWAYKTITQDDLKFPLVYGDGKRARVLATIGVTRGFGDHDLKVQSSDIHIKPFMLAIPQVKIYDMCDYDHSANDVLIMASDGLWDVTTNEKAASIVSNCLQQFDLVDRSRYTSAAQELVMYARGLLKKGWRTADDTPASGDDITAFVIPLNVYSNSPSESSSTESSLDASSS